MWGLGSCALGLGFGFGLRKVLRGFGWGLTSRVSTSTPWQGDEGLRLGDELGVGVRVRIGINVTMVASRVILLSLWFTSNPNLPP